MIRVLVAVSDPVVARGLQSVLGDAEDCRCVASTREPERIRPLAEETAPDVLLLDASFRRGDASLLPGLLELDPAPGVLVYVDHGPEECVVRHLVTPGGRSRLSGGAVARLDDCCLTSLEHDARGCLAKGASPEQVVDAVRAVAAGEIVAGPWLTVVARSVQGRNGRSDPDAISPRELEVMVLLAEGLTNREIGARLGIREQTVKNHVSRTMAKLGVDNRLEVGLLAAKHDLRLVDQGPGEA